MKEKRLYIIAIIGAIICFIGDNLLGAFTPSPDFGFPLMCINFSYEWADVNPIQFAIAGMCGVVSLIMMFAGFYGIYIRLKEKGSRLAKGFLFSSFLFVSVGTLYHNVFSIAAYIYNRLCESGFVDAKSFTIDVFQVFIIVGGLAAVGYVGMVVIIFISAIKGELFKHKWMCLVNPFILMIVCIILSKVLPQTAFVNGVFNMSQQSIGLFVVFCVLYFTCERKKLS